MTHIHYTCPAKSLLYQLDHRKYMDFYVFNFNTSFFTPLLDTTFLKYPHRRVKNRIFQRLNQ